MAELRRAVDAGSPSKRSILVVDDEFLIRWALQEDLKSCFSVRTAASVDEALGLLESAPVDAVLTDLRMPLRGGIDLVKIVRSRWPDVKVFVMSAVGTDDDMRRCYECDVEAVLRKPLEMPLIRRLIELHLGGIRSLAAE